MDNYDVVVIGGGPGGYVAAIRCAQLGLRTACVDDWRNEDGKPALGGTCLNVGCIPSKALLDYTHHYHPLQHGIAAHGIPTGSVKLDGSVWRRRGSEVTVLNRGASLLAKVDEDIAKEAQRQLVAQGLDIRLDAKVDKVTVAKKSVTLHVHDGEGERDLKVDRVLVATGRVPNTAGLNADGVGLALDARGYIVVDEHCRANLANVYAIGDVVRGPMLAHKASDEGVMVAEHIAGQAGHVNYETIPWVIYTWPEIAWVGQTTQQLRNANRDFRAGVFPFIGNGRAQAMGDTAGLVKIVSDAKTDRVLGVHIIGPLASELIGEAVAVMEFGGAAEDIARTVHAHPTLSEALHEAALAVAGRALHR